MYFRSLLKTRLLRPIAFGLYHPYSLIFSGCHWIKCTSVWEVPVTPYFYGFSTQKSQSQGSVKDLIENSNAKGGVNTQVKVPKELQKEFEAICQQLKVLQQKVDPKSKRLKDSQKEVKPKTNFPEGDKPNPKNPGQLGLNLTDIKSIIIKIAFSAIISLIIFYAFFFATFYGNKRNWHYIQEKLPIQLGQKNYIQSKAPPKEDESQKFAEEYIETPSRTSVKEMLTLSDKKTYKQVHYISGVPGIGKTTTMKEVIKQMKKENYEICYFSFKGKSLETTIHKILTTALYLQKACPKDIEKNKKKYIMIDQLDLITSQEAKTNLTINQRREKIEEIVMTMVNLMDSFGYNIVFISSSLNFFDQELRVVRGLRESRYRFLNFKQPSIKQMTDYLKGLKSKTAPAFKLDEVIITHMLQNYSTFREMKKVLETYFTSSGDRVAETLQMSKQQIDHNKLIINAHCNLKKTSLLQKEQALYEICLQKQMPIDMKVYRQLNRDKILNQNHFRSLQLLRGFELYYNENHQKFEKLLEQKFKEQFKDHKIHCKEVFLDRPAN